MNKIIYELVIDSMLENWAEDHECPDTCNGDPNRMCNECFNPDVVDDFLEDYEQRLRGLSPQDLQKEEYFDRCYIESDIHHGEVNCVTHSDVLGELNAAPIKHELPKKQVINPSELRTWLLAPLGVSNIPHKHKTSL